MKAIRPTKHRRPSATPLGAACACLLAVALACRPEAPPEPLTPNELGKTLAAEPTPRLDQPLRQSAAQAAIGLNMRELVLEDEQTPWYQRVQNNANRDCLRESFDNLGYQPPERSFLLAARVLEGKDEPAFEYYSLDDTGFLYSVDELGQQRFWPASTIKLAAAVAALERFHQLGLDGDTSLSLEDEHGPYQGTLRQIYQASIVKSSNPAYNYTMMIVGFDEINQRFLTPEKGFPSMVLQRRYERLHKDSNMRESVPISYQKGKKQGELPRRLGTEQYPQCPREGNCCTLFELLDVLRRVALHDELASNDRFAIPPADVAPLQRALRDAPSCIEDGAKRALGAQTLVYNKGGKVIGDDRLDVALIVAPNGERTLLALSVKYEEGIELRTNELAERTLQALQGCAGRAPALQAHRLPMDASQAQLDLGTRHLRLCHPGEGSWSAWANARPIEIRSTAGQSCLQLELELSLERSEELVLFNPLQGQLHLRASLRERAPMTAN